MSSKTGIPTKLSPSLCASEWRVVDQHVSTLVSFWSQGELDLRSTRLPPLLCFAHAPMSKGNPLAQSTRCGFLSMRQPSAPKRDVMGTTGPEFGSVFCAGEFISVGLIRLSVSLQTYPTYPGRGSHKFGLVAKQEPLGLHAANPSTQEILSQLLHCSAVLQLFITKSVSFLGRRWQKIGASAFRPDAYSRTSSNITNICWKFGQYPYTNWPMASLLRWMHVRFQLPYEPASVTVAEARELRAGSVAFSSLLHPSISRSVSFRLILTCPKRIKLLTFGPSPSLATSFNKGPKTVRSPFISRSLMSIVTTDPHQKARGRRSTHRRSLLAGSKKNSE